MSGAGGGAQSFAPCGAALGTGEGGCHAEDGSANEQECSKDPKDGTHFCEVDQPCHDSWLFVGVKFVSK
jgi:hypothetical protein